jgi:hypothetical protein
MTRRTVLIVGDSHIYAIKAALADTGADTFPFEFKALRLSTEKNGTKIGDIDYPDVLTTVAGMNEDDAVALALRGNQYNTLGLILHPRPFDVMVAGMPNLPEEAYAEIIPNSTARFFMSDSLKRGYGKMLTEIIRACVPKVFCLSAPAPKEDEEHIKRGAEQYFRDAGIDKIGVTPAILRLKLWELQQQALAEFCEDKGVTFLANPTGSRDDKGFLARDYYAGDATHANTSYGKLVLRQIAAALTD